MNEMPDSLLTTDEPALVTVYNENGESPILIVADQPESALCRCALGTPWWDQKQGKSYSHGRSGWFLFRRDDRAAKLTHENSHVVGTTFLRDLRRILILHTHTVIGNNQPARPNERGRER
jgi:hypothetical protein